MPWPQFIIQILLTIVSLVIALTALYITYTQTRLLERQINFNSKAEQPSFIAVIEPNGPIINNQNAHVDLGLYADLSFVRNKHLHIERYDAIELELNKVGVGSERFLIPMAHYFASCGRTLRSKEGEVYKCHGLNNSQLSSEIYEKFFTRYNDTDGKIYANGFSHYLRVSYEDLENNNHIAYVAVSSRGELDFESARNGYNILEQVYKKAFLVSVGKDPQDFIETLKEGHASEFLKEFFSKGQ